MNRYRVVGPDLVHLPGATHGKGDEFEHEWSEEEEATQLAAGTVEIVARDYRVVGGSTVHDTAPGDTFTAALPIGIETLLVQGGHIERVDPLTTAPEDDQEDPPPPPKKGRK